MACDCSPKRVDYMVFDVLTMLLPGENVIGSMLGNYKWGYTDVWCNMTAARGPGNAHQAICRCARDFFSVGLFLTDCA